MEQKVNIIELNDAEKAMLSDARRLDRLSEEIRREAEKRILKIVPEFKQRNLLMTAFQLLMHFKQSGQFTKSEKRLWADVQSVWLEIDAIRQISNEMERMADEGALPDNWREDVCWQ